MTARPLPPLILASASPRRRDLLRRLGLPFQVHPSSVDEDLCPDESPEMEVRRLATRKAEDVHRAHAGALILAADTLVVLDKPDGIEIFGKPTDRDSAAAMLRRLADREHRVLTGVALCAPSGQVVTELGATRVRFAALDPAVIDWYVSTGEPLDKAGAYAIQGAAALFIDDLQGSWSNVVGLPLERLPNLFRAAGYDLVRALGRRRGRGETD